ncbi:HAD family hydrolase, partial [Thermobifida halotolerans]|uniref:HAD family hydrolase n=1 Tax=Thermobifida halotolerans TaxID=483545 RepID=UPI0012F503B5
MAAETPQAVLFDMDGTLIDTEQMWAASEAEVAAAFGHEWTAEDQRHCLGGSAPMVASHIAGCTGARTSETEIVAMLYAAMERRLAEGAPVRPGAKELLAELDAEGVPMALVTSTYRSMVAASLRCVGDHCFTVSVAGDEGSR